MYNKNGLIITNAAKSALNSFPGVLVDINGDNVPGSSTPMSTLITYCSFLGTVVSSSNFKIAKSTTEISGSYVYLSAGKRESKPTVDTYSPVFSNLDLSITQFENGYSVITLSNSSGSDIEINEVDFSIAVGSTKVLFAIFEINAITLKDGDSFSFSLMHT